MKMELCSVIIFVLLINAYSASKIFQLDDDEPLTIAAANIVDKCFASSERRSELLIIPDDDVSREIIKEIYRASKTLNSIVFLDSQEKDELTHDKECENYLNTNFEWQDTKPTAVIIAIQSLKRLKSLLCFLKKGTRTVWRPESYFVIVLETKCDATEYNDALKLIWAHWILNAVILCSSKDSTDRNQPEIELYTFNPYSGDHSQQWETIIHETVEVSIDPGNFSHSWYIFKRRFAEIRTLEDCDHLFFGKTLNLDEYVIPITIQFPEILLDVPHSDISMKFAPDRLMLETISKRLRFNSVQVHHSVTPEYGMRLENGSYSGTLEDIYTRRSHLAPSMYPMYPFPGLGMIYPHDEITGCFASRVVGLRPQWTNLADAKQIWIALGIGLIFSAVVLYLQNKSHGVVSALLDAERLVVGSSIIRASTEIKQRIILGSIFLVVLVVDGAFRGRFISILTIVRPYPDIDTLEQLRERRVTVYGHSYIGTMITDPEIKAHFSSRLNASECLTTLNRKDQQEVCMEDCRGLRFLTSNSTHIHIASDPFNKGYTVYVASLHWPMTDRYSFEVQKIVEAGILKKWTLDMYRRLEVDSWKMKRSADSSYIRPLDLNSLLPALALLFLGSLISLIIFAWENKSSKNK